LVPNDPILSAALFPWTTEIRSNWQAIQAELETILQRRDQLPVFQDISPDQYGISPDDKWRIFGFYGFGYRSAYTCQLCPHTASLLERVPGIENAFFSILAPGKMIPSHRGVTKGLIRVHLGLRVPPDSERCFMDVGGVRCRWQEGQVLIFDDTYPHAVSNDTDQERVVLLFDFRRPLSVRGCFVRQVLFWVFRRTAYVREALQNEMRWEQRYRDAGA